MTALVRWIAVVTDTVFDEAVVKFPVRLLVYVAFALLLMIVPDGVSDHPADENRCMNKNDNRMITRGEENGTAPATGRTAAVPSPVRVKERLVCAPYMLKRSLIKFPSIVPAPKSGQGDHTPY